MAQADSQVALRTQCRLALAPATPPKEESSKGDVLYASVASLSHIHLKQTRHTTPKVQSVPVDLRDRVEVLL